MKRNEKMKKMLLKIWAQNSTKPTTRIYKVSGRRFSSSIVPNIFKKGYVKVSYGTKVCNFGCKCEFFNDGEYTTRTEFIKAIKDFLEED